MTWFPAFSTLRRRSVAVVIALGLWPVSLVAQNNARDSLARARDLLDVREFRTAEQIYSSLMSASDTPVQANARFGHAFAQQQRWLAGDSTSPLVTIGTVI